MEQPERIDVVVNAEVRKERVYEKYGWMVLAVSAVFGIVAAVLTTLPPLSWFTNPVITMTYSLMGALGVTWVGFNLFALILTLIPFRRGERWAWFTLWMLPLLWLSQFVLAPDLSYYLVLAIISTVGLILPYRRYFSRTEKEELV
jgi:uncharacterized membrane protein YozB (DUF420 family)